LPSVDLSYSKKARTPGPPEDTPIADASKFCLPCVSPATAYLLGVITTQTEAIKELGTKNGTLIAEKLQLIEENDRLHTSRADPIQMCREFDKKKLESQTQVSHLKELLTSNVASLTTKFAMVKASLVA
jgi:hypothetical protein